MHWRHLEIWEDLPYSSQLFFGKGSGELVLVGDVGSDVFLGAEFSRLVVGDKLRVKLGSEDSFRRTEVVCVGVIRHGRGGVNGSWSCRERGDRVLARHSAPYMSVLSGPRTLKLPYRFRGMYVLVINPLVIRVWVSLPFDQILLLSSSAELPRV